MRSTRSISWTWYCIVSRSSNVQVAFGPSARLRLRLCSITLARNSLRAVEYCSRLIRSWRDRCGGFIASDPVGHAQQLQRMRRLARLLQARLDLMSGHRAVARIEIRTAIDDAAHDRAADLHRHVVVLALDAVGAVVPGAALDRLDLRLRHEHQHVTRLQPEILHAQVTRHVIADLAELAREVGPQQPAFVARPQV